MRKMNKKTFRGKLLSLVLPITFQQLMVTVVSASDALMVGVIGQDLLSAVSLASQVTFVYNLFIAALTIGTSMFAAQYWGKGDKDAVERVLGIVMRTSVPVSAVFFVLTTFAPEALMRIFTSDPALIGYGSDYLRIVGVTYLLCGVSQIYLCIMKNSDLAAKSMIIGSAAALLNIVLNAVLIYGLLGGGPAGDGAPVWWKALQDLNPEWSLLRRPSPVTQSAGPCGYRSVAGIVRVSEMDACDVYLLYGGQVRERNHHCRNLLCGRRFWIRISV